MNTREGETSRTDSAGQTPSAWDHDPPGAEKLVPFGILMLATGALSLNFGSAETSDFWVDALQHWWTAARGHLSHIKRLVIYLDNGPKNSGSRTRSSTGLRDTAIRSAERAADESPASARGRRRTRDPSGVRSYRRQATRRACRTPARSAARRGHRLATAIPSRVRPRPLRRPT